ncbi:MAG TPA: hypothetical protein VK203_11875 [Nostocaceae cyanobacterium]|nr:hypothetical protein [Nostocaceae cyanobacterium]
MDRYFFMDLNIIFQVLHFTAVVLILLLGYIVGKRIKFKLLSIILVVIFEISLSEIPSMIRENDTHMFIESKINSVVTELVEWRPENYRCVLRNGLKFYKDSGTKFLIQIGDSIEKKERTDSLNIFRKDYTGKYVLETSCRYNEIAW